MAGGNRRGLCIHVYLSWVLYPDAKPIKLHVRARGRNQSDCNNVLCLQAFLTLSNSKLNGLTFNQCFKA